MNAAEARRLLDQLGVSDAATAVAAAAPAPSEATLRTLRRILRGTP